MKTSIRLRVCVVAAVFAAAHAQAYLCPQIGRFASRDPFTEPGFYLQTTGHQASENSGPTDDSDGDSTPNLNDFLTASSPNVSAFVDNDAINKTDPLGLVIIAFYGADYWGSGDNSGANPQILQIATDVHAVGPYRSLDILDPYQYLLHYFSNGQAACNNNEPIKIFGHSWGAISAVKLSRWLGQSPLRNHEIDVYTIDPVSLLRTRPISVPSTVTYFWNRYEKTGGRVLGPLRLHGRWLPSQAMATDEKQLFGVNHVTIVDQVTPELEQKLKQQ